LFFCSTLSISFAVFNQLINSIHLFNFYVSESDESTGKTGEIFHTG